MVIKTNTLAPKELQEAKIGGLDVPFADDSELIFCTLVGRKYPVIICSTSLCIRSWRCFSLGLEEKFFTKTVEQLWMGNDSFIQFVKKHFIRSTLNISTSNTFMNWKNFNKQIVKLWGLFFVLQKKKKNKLCRINGITQ